MSDQMEATVNGNELAQELGEGWTEDVWENLGWHYNATSPSHTVQVYPTARSGYMALIHAPGERSGQPGLTGHGDTPRKAVEDTVTRTRKEIAKLEQWLDGVN